jgi:acyl-CoA dehydrogenase
MFDSHADNDSNDYMDRTIFTTEHRDFRESVRAFLRAEALPHAERWEDEGIIDRSFWRRAGAQGLVGFAAPEAYGGAGIDDFRFNAIIDEEVAYLHAVGDNFSLQNDVVLPYLLELSDEQQRARWLPPFVTGDHVVAIAMSEPGAGSDLRGIAAVAHPTDGGYSLSGSKTFVTSGIQADGVIVVARVAGAPAAELSLFYVPATAEGFQRGRKLDKVGRRAQDTAELFFDEVGVPAEDVIGEPGQGLVMLKRNLAQERLSIAVNAVAAAEAAFWLTAEYCKERRAFGRPIGSHQAIRFALADMHTEVQVARVYIDRCLELHVEKMLSDADAAGAKRLATELQFAVVDRCVQLHGGYGYMEEYPIARMWRDARVQRIYGGTSEIMQEIVGRDLGF